MNPGYVHFEVRHGLTADMLVSAMAALLGDYHEMAQIFPSLGLPEITFRVGPAEAFGLKGTCVHFYANDILISLNSRSVSEKASHKPSDHHDFVHDCLLNKSVSLLDIKSIFEKANTKPTVAAIAIRILENMGVDQFLEHKLSGNEALWLMCHLAMLSFQVEILAPKFVSSSNIFLGSCDAKNDASVFSLRDPLWIRHVLTMVPTIEEDRALAVDVLAASFLKTLSGHFGPRGKSTIMKIGVGLSEGYVEALWCEAFLPKSIAESGPTKKQEIAFVYEVSGLCDISVDMSHLASSMVIHGAQFFTWQLVYGEQGKSLYRAQFICLSNDKTEAIEAFLTKGSAREVRAILVEHHQLDKRMVAVPLGKGNKVSSARFYEYLYYDKIVRVEPVAEDLDGYMHKTEQGIDVARADLLLAWKKWRGRLASD